MYKLRNLTAYLFLGIVTVSTVRSANAGEVVATDIETAILQASLESGIDHDLLRAMAKVESNNNPKALGKLGEIGLFQLRPEYFGKSASVNPALNARTAATYLKKLRTRCQDYGDAWFVCFNTGPNRRVKLAAPSDFAYYRKVMAAKQATARTLASDY